MGQYVARRLLIAIPTLLVISFVVYAILALAPGDPLGQFAANPNVPPEVRERIRESLGLNQPWHIRYVKWLLALLQGAGRAFSAGGSFELLDTMLLDYAARTRVLREARDLVFNVINCSKPIVSAMIGPAAAQDLHGR